MSLSGAGRRQYSEAEVKRLAVDLVEELTSLGHPADAAHIAVAYLADADNAVLLFAQARQWREALRIAYQCARPSPHCFLPPHQPLPLPGLPFGFCSI
jgi:hypothetical protein